MGGRFGETTGPNTDMCQVLGFPARERLRPPDGQRAGRRPDETRAIRHGEQPDDSGPIEAKDGPPDGDPMQTLAESPEAFIVDYHPQGILTVARMLYRKAKG